MYGCLCMCVFVCVFMYVCICVYACGTVWLRVYENMVEGSRGVGVFYEGFSWSAAASLAATTLTLRNNCKRPIGRLYLPLGLDYDLPTLRRVDPQIVQFLPEWMTQIATEVYYDEMSRVKPVWMFDFNMPPIPSNYIPPPLHPIWHPAAIRFESVKKHTMHTRVLRTNTINLDSFSFILCMSLHVFE